MKKIYQQPTVKVLAYQALTILAASGDVSGIDTNVDDDNDGNSDIGYGGGGEGTGDSTPRAREGWSVWD